MLFGELVRGTGCVGGQKKECMGCFLDDLNFFGTNGEQSTTASKREENAQGQDSPKYACSGWFAPHR